MARFGLIVAVIVLAGSGLPWAFGDGAASQPAGPSKARPGMVPVESLTPTVSPEMKTALGSAVQMFADMGHHLKLTADQRTKIKDQQDVVLKRLEDFHTAAVQKAKDESAAINASNGAERDKLRRVMLDDNSKAQGDYQNLIATGQAEVNAILTPEQRVSWETYKLTRSLTAILRTGPELSDAQRKQMKSMVDEAGKELAEAKDPTAAPAVIGKLMKKLVAEVLTEEQAGHVVTSGSPTIIGMPSVPGGRMMPVDQDLP